MVQIDISTSRLLKMFKSFGLKLSALNVGYELLCNSANLALLRLERSASGSAVDCQSVQINTFKETIYERNRSGGQQLGHRL